jgi:hypothetical protein
MRRLTIIATLLAALLTGLGVTGTPAEAATRTRVKAVITSLSGERLLLLRVVVRCTTNRPSGPEDCTENWGESRIRRYSKTIRVKRTHSAGMFFFGDQRFRMRVYTNGVLRHDRKAFWLDGEDIWVRGFVFYGPGAVVVV